jgi:hypothetical protein
VRRVCRPSFEFTDIPRVAPLGNARLSLCFLTPHENYHHGAVETGLDCPREVWIAALLGKRRDDDAGVVGKVLVSDGEEPPR